MDLVEVLHTLARQRGRGDSPIVALRQVAARPGARISHLAVSQRLAEAWVTVTGEPFHQHQSLALAALRRGEPLALVGGAPARRTMHLLALELLRAESPATALLLAPDELAATAHRASLERIAGALGEPLRVGLAIGEEARAAMAAHVVIATPTVLHERLLRHHGRAWASFWSRLRLIILAEAQTYDGLAAGHLAALLRRAQRLAPGVPAGDAFGAGEAAAQRLRPPQLAATIGPLAGADEALAQITGLPWRIIPADDTPAPEATIALWRASGERAREAAALATGLARAGTAVHLTCPAFEAPLLRALIGPDDGGPPEASARGAISIGPTPQPAPVQIFAGLAGAAAFLRPALDGASLAVVILGDDPAERTMARLAAADPDQIPLIDGPPPAWVPSPGNAYVLAQHLVCAASERPFAATEVAAWQAATLIPRLEERGLLIGLPGPEAAWQPLPSGEDPYHGLDLRGAGSAPARIRDEQGRALGSIDQAAFDRWGFVGGALPPLRGGYRVVARDEDALELTLRALPEQRRAIPLRRASVRVRDRRERRLLRGREVGWGRVVVDEEVYAYREAAPGSAPAEHTLAAPIAISWSAPALWVDLPAPLRVGGQLVGWSLAAALQLRATTPPSDLAPIYDEQTHRLYFVDAQPGGSGLAAWVFGALDELLPLAYDVALDCRADPLLEPLARADMDWLLALLGGTADDRRPTTGDRRPADDRRPTTDDRRPTTDDRRPTTSRRPTTDGQPATDDRRPAGDRRPTTDGQPTTDDRRPADDRRPTALYRRPGASASEEQPLGAAPDESEPPFPGAPAGEAPEPAEPDSRPPRGPRGRAPSPAVSEADAKRLRAEQEARAREEQEARAREVQEAWEREKQARLARAAREREEQEAWEREKQARLARAAREREEPGAREHDEPDAPEHDEPDAPERIRRERAEQEAQQRAEQEYTARLARERAAREREERERTERAERERLAREAQQRAEQEAREREEQEAQQRADRARLAREARERAEQEAQQRAEQEAQQRAERERLAREAQQRAEQEAQQRAEREAWEAQERAARKSWEEEQRRLREERERLAREAREREAREREARERAEQEAQEARERAERLALEAQERAEREAQERAEREAQERAIREARTRAEKAERERLTREREAQEARTRAEKAERERLAREQAAAEARERAEEAERERLSREQAIREREAQEARARAETAVSEAGAKRERLAREQAAAEARARAEAARRGRAAPPPPSTRPPRPGDRQGQPPRQPPLPLPPDPPATRRGSSPPQAPRRNAPPPESPAPRAGAKRPPEPPSRHSTPPPEPEATPDATAMVERLRRMREQRERQSGRSTSPPQQRPSSTAHDETAEPRFRPGDQIVCTPYGSGKVIASHIEDDCEILLVTFPSLGQLTIDAAVSAARLADPDQPQWDEDLM